MKPHRFSWLTCVSTAVLCGLLVSSAALGAINPGFDLLSTPPGGGVLPHPLGGPPILLQGRPIGPGNTDTIVQRTGGLPPGGTGTIPAQLVALSLESVAPVQLGASFFDIFVDLDPAAASMGHLDIMPHNDPGGGTFDSFFDVFSRITLTEVGNPSNVQVMARHDQISSQGSPWSHMKPQHYPENRQYPSGNFYPGVIPGTATPVGINHTGPHPHTDPSTPEPGTAFLMVIGMAGLMAAGRRRLH